MHSNVTFPGTVPIIGIFAVALIYFFTHCRKLGCFSVKEITFSFYSLVILC